MKIITRAALAAATLVLTAAVPALADGDHGSTQTGQKGSSGSAANSRNSSPTKINLDEDSDADYSQGLLPRVMGQLL
ncbi:hypothetical protein [Streptomyces sp. NPDC053069]|uniref:hypothetical protein n=1 Tax=Streptomyces sp. NPDC053069 TaxID=3365695 RepID=UPI0037D444F9